MASRLTEDTRKAAERYEKAIDRRVNEKRRDIIHSERNGMARGVAILGAFNDEGILVRLESVEQVGTVVKTASILLSDAARAAVKARLD